MKLIYGKDKLKLQCNSVAAAQKLFSGNRGLALSLLSRINALEQAETIKDIIVQKNFRFHKLINKDGRDLEGYFAIDVKTRKDPWRIILEPLDDNENAFVPCNIDEISNKVRIVGIMEVSKHYE